MKAPYLLDTNVASYVIKGNIPSVDRWLAKVPVESVFISTVTEAELRYGIARRMATRHARTRWEDDGQFGPDDRRSRACSGSRSGDQ